MSMLTAMSRQLKCSNRHQYTVIRIKIARTNTKTHIISIIGYRTASKQEYLVLHRTLFRHKDSHMRTIRYKKRKKTRGKIVQTRWKITKFNTVSTLILRRVVADNIYSFIFGTVLSFHALRLMQILYISDFQMQNNVPRNEFFLFCYRY